MTCAQHKCAYIGVGDSTSDCNAPMHCRNQVCVSAGAVEMPAPAQPVAPVPPPVPEEKTVEAHFAATGKPLLVSVVRESAEDLRYKGSATFP